MKAKKFSFAFGKGQAESIERIAKEHEISQAAATRIVIRAGLEAFALKG